MNTGVFYLPRSDEPVEVATARSVISSVVDSLRRQELPDRALKIAIGNGSGCRETERFVSDLIKDNFFVPFVAEYSMVNESGASVYSVTPLAEAELPNVDANIRSAISIARRLQDPLAELVKIEPKHLGVGMYQHDLDAKMLAESLDAVVEECVSFVGVDVNVCSQQLLQRVAGMNRARAKSVVEFRKAAGRIHSRLQLLAVNGLGKKTFEQCAGFVNIHPERAREDGDCERRPRAELEYNPLDATCVHPESYRLAESLIESVGCTVADMGTEKLRAALAKTLAAGDHHDETFVQVVEALRRPPLRDLRDDMQGALFRQGITSLTDVRAGAEMSGGVTNVTNFGAFVDVGVGQDGLIHRSGLPRGVTLDALQVGTRVHVRVLSVDSARKRIGLLLLHIR